MCGIILGISQKEKVNTFVIDQLQDQLSRGKKGFGIVFIDKENNIEIRRATHITKTLLDLYTKKSNIILLHHRFPTSTDNKMIQTHPIEINEGNLKYKYLIVHNGIISNDDELKEKHEKLGFTYQTEYTEITGTYEKVKFNDSEAAAIEIARLLDGQETELELNGSVAFIAIKINKETKKAMSIYYGRNDGNPLKLAKSRGTMTLSSEGKGEEVKPFMLYNLDIKTLKLKKQKLKFKEEEIELEEIDVKQIPFHSTQELKRPLDITETETNWIKNYKEQPYDEIVIEMLEEIELEVGKFARLFDHHENIFSNMVPEATDLARKIIRIILTKQNDCKDGWLEDRQLIKEEFDDKDKDDPIKV